MLHVTNGDSAVERLVAAGMEGELLPWRDVLHDGPVPSGLDLTELSRVRARFIADCGWAEFEDVHVDFQSRDRVLEAFAEHEEVVLWFEHDLFDQLQLLQLLDWFSDRSLGRTRLSLVQTNEYLGMLEPDRTRAYFAERPAVRPAQLELARAAWAAFRASDPTDLDTLAEQPCVELPFLRSAVRRYLEQYPWVDTGLSRTEAHALAAIADGRETIRAAYPAAHGAVEDPVWLGDGVFVWYLERLATERQPLVKLGAEPDNTLDRTVAITALGRDVVEGRADRVALNGIDRWLGGVRLSGEEAAWRWDPRAARLRVAL